MASVQGTVPDQSWALSLPSKFHENIKPTVYDANFLLPRDNDLIPNVVSKNTSGACYDRGYIDLRPGRLETIRQYITNPSSYVQDLHPFGLGGGTGGVDNLNMLDNHAHPTPVVNMEGFEEIDYLARRESLIEQLDPLSNGYAIKVLGEQGENIVRRHELSKQIIAERDRMLAARRELTLREGQAMNPAEADIGAANRISSESAKEIDRAANDEIARRAKQASDEAERARKDELPKVEITPEAPKPAITRKKKELAYDGPNPFVQGLLIANIANAYGNPNAGGSAAGQGTRTNLMAQQSAAARQARVTADQNRSILGAPNAANTSADTLAPASQTNTTSTTFTFGEGPESMDAGMTPPTATPRNLDITPRNLNNAFGSAGGSTASRFTSISRISGLSSTPQTDGSNLSADFSNTSMPGRGGGNYLGTGSSMNNTPYDLRDMGADAARNQYLGSNILVRLNSPFVDQDAQMNARTNINLNNQSKANFRDGSVSTPYQEGEFGRSSFRAFTLETAPGSVPLSANITQQGASARNVQSNASQLRSVGPLSGPIRVRVPAIERLGNLNLAPANAPRGYNAAKAINTQLTGLRRR